MDYNNSNTYHSIPTAPSNIFIAPDIYLPQMVPDITVNINNHINVYSPVQQVSNETHVHRTEMESNSIDSNEQTDDDDDDDDETITDHESDDSDDHSSAYQTPSTSSDDDGDNEVKAEEGEENEKDNLVKSSGNILFNMSQQHNQSNHVSIVADSELNLLTPASSTHYDSSSMGSPVSSASESGSTSSQTRQEDKIFDQIEDILSNYMRDPVRHYLQYRILRWAHDDDHSKVFTAIVVINPPMPYVPFKP